MKRLLCAIAVTLAIIPGAAAAAHTADGPSGSPTAQRAVAEKGEATDVRQARKAKEQTAAKLRQARESLMRAAGALKDATAGLETTTADAAAARVKVGDALAARNSAQAAVDRLVERKSETTSRIRDLNATLANQVAAVQAAVKAKEPAATIERLRAAAQGTRGKIAAARAVAATIDQDLTASRTTLSVARTTLSAAQAEQRAADAAHAAQEQLVDAAEAVVGSAEKAHQVARAAFEKAANQLARALGKPLPFPGDSNGEWRPASFTIGTRNTHVGRAPVVRIADVIGWQELNSAQSRGALRTKLSGYSSSIPSNESAQISISWRTDKFALVSSGNEFTHGAVPNGTPSRWIHWVRLEHRTTGQRLIFINTHFIQNAWKGGPEAGWRMPKWQGHLGQLKQVVNRQQESGLPVFVVGDMNYRGNLNLSGLRKLETNGAKIDHIYASRSKRVSTSRQLELGKLGSDHHAYRAQVTLYR